MNTNQFCFFITKRPPFVSTKAQPELLLYDVINDERWMHIVNNESEVADILTNSGFTTFTIYELPIDSQQKLTHALHSVFNC